MQVIVSNGTDDERRFLAEVIQGSFPDAEIVDAAGGVASDRLPADRKATPHSDVASGLDRDLQAAALLPIENPNPVLRIAPDGTVLFANRASDQLFAARGVTRGGRLPKRWCEWLQDVLDDGRQRRMQLDIGDQVFEFDCVPIVDAGYINVYGRNITEQARAGAALRAERDLLQAVMEHSRVSLVYLDPDFNFVAMNTAYEIGCQRSRDVMLGRNHFELFPNAENETIFRQVRDTGQAVEYLARPFEFADMPWRGVTYWDWTLTPVKRDDGSVRGLIFSLVDVTERVRAQEVLEQRVQERTAELTRRGAALAKANEALSQREASLRYQAAVLDNVNDAIVAYGVPDLRITAWNRCAEAQYGWTAEEALGRRAPEMVGSRLDPEQRAEIVRSVEATGRWRGELKHTRRDGTPIVVETTSTALYDDAGHTIAHVTANRDITERKRMEEALQAHRERLEILHQIDRSILVARAPAEIAQVAIAEFLQAVDAQRVTVSLFDLATETAEVLADAGVEAQSYSAGTRIPLARYPMIDRVLAGQIAGIEDFAALPANWPAKDMTLRAGIRSTTLVPLIAGETVIGLLSASRAKPGQLPSELLNLALHVADSLAVAVHNARLNQELAARQAELIRANEALSQREAALRYQATLLENVNDAVIAFDDNLRITAWNHAAEELYGWRAEEVMGTYTADVVRSQATEQERAARLRTMAETGKWQGEITHTRRDGTPIIVEGTSMTLRDETGRIFAHVTVNRDITERKRAEEELRANRVHLQNLAHRLVELQENERYEVANQLYNDEGQRLAALILGLGRLQRENRVDEAGVALVAELAELASGVLTDMHSLAVNLRPATLDRLGLRAALIQAMIEFGRHSGVETQCELPDLADLHLSPQVETNVYRIVQAALANIAQHANATCVSLSAVREEAKLIFILDDNGVGFDVEQTRQQGAIGLLGMEERAEALGGRLAIESVPGKGTTLYIQVPKSANGT